VGSPLRLHGHGLRPRTVYVRSGPRTAVVEILVRRYVCLACDAVVLVLPADLARGHLYSLLVIAAALARWCTNEQSARAVRAELSAFSIIGAASTGWPSLTRWARSASRLWPRLKLRSAGTSPRHRARMVSVQLCAFAPMPTGRVVVDAVAGAVHAA
jgi:hypothetical protein